jgi:acyl carrier protein
MTPEEAIKWIAELFEEPADRLKPETKKADIPGWDSLGILNLMAGLDSDFNILLSEDEIVKLHNVGDILNLLSRHGQLN